MSLERRLYPGLNLGATDPETHLVAEEKIFGFWIFLMSDMVLFSVLFATYAAMSSHGIADGPGPKDIFELGPAFIETMLLLGSSFTFGFAALAMKYEDGRGPLLAWLLVTWLLGAGFVAMEVLDYITLITEKGAPPTKSGFLSAYFLLTGTHAVHVTGGLIWMAIMAVQVMVFGVVGTVKLRLMRLALFWHMLDVVWIGIFTFVYLFGVAA